ncbi:MAG: 4Fe-4S binding protein [Deferrisomatales bacterium]|nr:4Fe-4S binding protein [Deferrisomatales bacterium]
MSDCCSGGLCSSKTYLTFQRQDGSPWTPMYVQQVDPEKCIGCGKCLKVCMGGCYEMVEIDGEKKARVVNRGNCMGDCHCHKVCPVEGGAMSCRAVEAGG